MTLVVYLIFPALLVYTNPIKAMVTRESNPGFFEWVVPEHDAARQVHVGFAQCPEVKVVPRFSYGPPLGVHFAVWYDCAGPCSALRIETCPKAIASLNILNCASFAAGPFQLLIA